MEKVEFKKIVTTIDYSSEENVLITTSDGSKYVASHVIFTASLGVLKKKHSTLFVPPLPPIKQRAIKVSFINDNIIRRNYICRYTYE